MEYEKIDYKGKTLEQFTTAGGDTFFITKSLFDILEQPIPDNFLGMELVQLDYITAMATADQYDEELGNFIRDKFGDLQPV